MTCLTMKRRYIKSFMKGTDTTTQISQMSKFGRTKVLKLLRQLEKRGYIRKLGEDRATKYILSK